MLETLLGQLTPYLEHGMVDSLDAFEQSLFRRAEQARNNEEQQRCFESLREVRRIRADMAPALIAQFEAALALLNVPRRQSALAKPQRGVRSELSLVDSGDLEESLVLVEAANRAEVRSSQPLFSLGMRFAVLAEAPVFEPEDLPIGPHRLSECVRQCSELLDLPGAHRVLFFRAVDQMLFARLEKFFDDANQILVDSRVLGDLIVLNPRNRRSEPDVHDHPTAVTHARSAAATHIDQGFGIGEPEPAQALHASPRRAEAPHPPSEPTQARRNDGTPATIDRAPARHTDAAAPTHDATPTRRTDTGAGAGAGQPRPPAPGSGATAAPSEAIAPTAPTSPITGTPESHAAASDRFQKRSAQTRFGLSSPPASTVAEAEAADKNRLAGFARPLTGWPGVPSSVPRDTASNDPQDRQMFQTMRELLSGRRQALGLGAAPAPDPKAVSARSDDVQSVLGVLQQRPAVPLSVGGKLVPRSIGHVKQDILNQLRQVTPEGHIPRLHEEDADTIDLVGLLFDNLAKHGTPNATVSQLMTKLQVPLLRVALRDKSFFSKRSHPARQLLNAVAESGLYWLDEGEEDRHLVEKMQGVVDRVLTEFHDDPIVFEQVLSDLSRHLQTQAHKSEVAERRHVDAARGREKLESARHTATAAIANKIGSSKPRALIRTLLEQAWTDVLALTVLRQGEDSNAYRERLGFVDGVIAFGNGDSQATAPARRETLRQQLETGLGQVGFHVEDIQSVGDRLFGSKHGASAALATNDDPATLTEVAARLKAHSRFGEEGDHHAHHHAQKAHVDPPLIAAELQVLAMLKTLPFGTWFEIAQDGTHERVRRKLSWFSTLTGRCLFVNQRGARSHESSLEQLARDIHEHRAKVYEEPNENLIDRAWHAIVRTLKSFTGQAPDTATEAG